MIRPRVESVLAILVVIAAWASTSVHAQQIKVRAYLQPEGRVSETTRVRLVVEAQGPGQFRIEPPRIDGLENLRLISGPSTSFNSVWNNGRFSATSQLIYTLQPEGPGEARVPQIAVSVDGRVYRTEPLEIAVISGQRGAPPPRAKPISPRTGSRGGRESVDVFIRVEIGSTDVWVGQSVPLTVLLYAAERVMDFAWTEEPVLSNFWVEALEVDPNEEAFRTTFDGRRYQVFPIKRHILVPQTAGTFEIEPHAAKVQVRARAGDPFDLFSLGRGETVVRKSQGLTLNVRELPEAGRPEAFGGAVGRYTLKAILDRNAADVNDALALTATVEGEGFLGAVNPPTFDVSPDLKVFDPKVSSSTRSERGRMVSRKTWEWILVPLVPGNLELGAARFSYFDPGQADYRTAEMPLETVVVQRAAEGADDAVARGQIQLQRRDLTFIKPLRGTLSSGRSRTHQTPIFVALLLAPVAWVPLLVLAGRHRARLAQNRGLSRSRRARSRAVKRLRATRRHLASGATDGFHEDVARALVEYVADRFDRSAAGLTYETADELLASRGTEPDLRGRFRGCLERCDFARYVPAGGAADRREEVLEEAEALIEQLERAW